MFGENKKTSGSFDPNLCVMEELVMKISCEKSIFEKIKILLE